MDYSSILARLRKECGFTQTEVAAQLSRNSDRSYGKANISSWENGVALPPIEQFLLLCELYGVNDIQATFRGLETKYKGLAKLNSLGMSRVDEYATMLLDNPLFAETDNNKSNHARINRYIKLYDIPVSAGLSSYLDSGSYEDLEVDETVPEQTDFAVRVSGDSMTPRFVDGQIVFIKRQESLDIGDIGIFEHAGNAFIKKFGRGQLISLNPLYKPIQIHEYDSFHILGKVVG